MNRGEEAERLFKEGCNCSVAVVLAFRDRLQETLGTGENELKKIAIGFGGGLARQRLTCGAVSGMTMVLGALLSDGEDKGEIYRTVQKACADFSAETGTLICADLLKINGGEDSSPMPEARTEQYYAKRPCLKLCGLAAEIAQKYLENSKHSDK